MLQSARREENRRRRQGDHGVTLPPFCCARRVYQDPLWLVPTMAAPLHAMRSIGVYGSSMRKPFGPKTSSASGVRMIGGTATETTTTR